jgi:MYXO-CTERM domain-containing protein
MFEGFMTGRHSRAWVRRLGTGWLLVAGAAAGATRSVGPSGTYPKPCAAIAAASDGDVIEIDASGSYAGDVCQVAKNGLTLRGVNGRAKIDAAGQNFGGKAIWVISGNDTTVENVEFSGAAVNDANGAGIRQEGANLTVRGCFFHDNQDGILAGDNVASQILIENSEFDHNGAGDGYSHNLYINHVGKFTFQYNYSHRAVEGHLLKSRAAETYVLYNRLTGEEGTASYEIDVPNGGKTYVIGNVVEQGGSTGNPAMLAYQEEGKNAANPSDALFVASNTFVNELGSGTFVLVGDSVTTKATLVNNVFSGGGTVCTQAKPVETSSYTGSAPGFVDAAHFDFHLTMASPCRDAGADAGSAQGFSLSPSHEYAERASSVARTTVGVIDIGAYEYGGAGMSDGGAAGAAGTSGNGGISGNTGGRSASGGRASSGGGTSSASGGTPSPAGGGAPGASGGRFGNAGTSSSGAPNAGASGNGGDAPTPETDAGTTPASHDSSGCGCRLSGEPTSPERLVAVLVAAATAITRRRRRSRK